MVHTFQNIKCHIIKVNAPKKSMKIKDQWQQLKEGQWGGQYFTP